MGCWNGTCAISQLPICWGDEIVLIPLLSKGNDFVSGLTYNSTDKFVPLGLPIYGKYNDYGGIEEISMHQKNKDFLKKQEFYKVGENEELTNEKLINALKNCNFKTIDYVARRIYEELKLDTVSIDDYDSLEDFINDFIYNDGFLIKNKSWQAEYSNTNYMMIHKGLYSLLIDEMGSRIPCGQEKPLKQLWKEKIKKEIDYHNKIMAIKDKEEREIRLWSYRLESMAKRLGLIDFNHEALGYNYILDNLSKEMDEELLDEFVDLILFTHAISKLRKGYLCMSGMGSQSNEVYMHTLVASFINEYAQNRIKKYDEEWIREDDFTEKEFLSDSTYWWNNNDLYDEDL